MPNRTGRLQATLFVAAVADVEEEAAAAIAERRRTIEVRSSELFLRIDLRGRGKLK